MKQVLMLRTLGNLDPLDLSPEEFNAVKSARTTLLAVLRVEEKYDIVIENYADYERELLGLALEKMLHPQFGWSSGAADRYTIGRRLANLLTVSRSYVDQTKHDANILFGANSAAACSLRAMFSAEYDASLGYRVMEALRNYLQHRGFPISLWYHSSWEEPAGRQCRYWVTPALDVKEMKEDKFKRSTYDELTKSNAEPNLTLFVRQFIEGISRIQSHFRETVANDLNKAMEEFSEVLQRARKHFEESIVSLAAVKLGDAGEQIEVLPVFQDIPERLLALTKRNPHLPTLSRWYVSSEVS